MQDKDINKIKQAAAAKKQVKKKQMEKKKKNMLHCRYEKNRCSYLDHTGRWATSVAANGDDGDHKSGKSHNNWKWKECNRTTNFVIII